MWTIHKWVTANKACSRTANVTLFNSFSALCQACWERSRLPNSSACFRTHMLSNTRVFKRTVDNRVIVWQQTRRARERVTSCSLKASTCSDLSSKKRAAKHNAALENIALRFSADAAVAAATVVAATALAATAVPAAMASAATATAECHGSCHGISYKGSVYGCKKQFKT